MISSKAISFYKYFTLPLVILICFLNILHKPFKSSETFLLYARKPACVSEKYQRY